MTLKEFHYDANGKLCQDPRHPFSDMYEPVACDSPPAHIVMQFMWPDHCIAGEDDASLGPNLIVEETDIAQPIGDKIWIDASSAFYDNGGFSQTGLHKKLQDLGVSHLYFVGLATDYSVQESAKDAKKLGYGATLITDATEGFDMINVRLKVLPNLKNQHGVILSTSDEVVMELSGKVPPTETASDGESSKSIPVGPPKSMIGKILAPFKRASIGDDSSRLLQSGEGSSDGPPSPLKRGFGKRLTQVSSTQRASFHPVQVFSFLLISALALAYLCFGRKYTSVDSKPLLL